MPIILGVWGGGGKRQNQSENKNENYLILILPHNKTPPSTPETLDFKRENYGNFGFS